ncbi:aldo/keto reductase [Streptomyces sp. JHA26]|uniref:aldo/keto reductase n=1 Tax=Streptomyces sp. JHA26 TaxID=1917143 RepID=UPI00098A0CB5|nr:aldo/keto reductase [Streptomyces sp. JHA26]
MRSTTFGRHSGLRVSEFALGTANFGTLWGGGANRDEAYKIFDRFTEAGGTLIDTSDSYQMGTAEQFLREFLGRERDNYVLTTKFSLGTGRPHPSTTGNSRKAVVRSVEASLKRLGTDYLDLYWAHLPDGLTPVEEILAALDDLVRMGKIMYAGLCNFPAWRVSRAVTLAELRGWSPLVGVQFEYSLAERSADRELLPMAEALGLGAALFAPLGGGLLTGKYRTGSAGRLSDWEGRGIRTEDSEQRTRVLDTVLDVARATGLTPAQVSMAWLRARAAHSPTTLVPLIGPRSADQLEGYLSALDVTLDDALVARLDEVSAVPLGQPHELVAGALRSAQGGQAVIRPAVPVA